MKKWTHLAFKYEAKKERAAYIYINSRHVCKRRNMGALSHSVDLFLGRGHFPNVSYFCGNMRQLKVWNYARTNQQIASSMFTHFPNERADRKGLTSCWPFELDFLDIYKCNSAVPLDKSAPIYFTDSALPLLPAVCHALSLYVSTFNHSIPFLVIVSRITGEGRR